MTAYEKQFLSSRFFFSRARSERIKLNPQGSCRQYQTVYLIPWLFRLCFGFVSTLEAVVSPHHWLIRRDFEHLNWADFS